MPLNVIKHETPWRSDRLDREIKLVVIHGDAGKSDAGTIDWITKDKYQAKVSYHYLVGRGGEVHQFVDESLKAWHAGISHWPACTVGRSVNAHSVGVAFANDGEESYRSEQYEEGARLVAGICKRHGVKAERVVGHADVSPMRKKDPWDHFDWKLFRTLLAERGVT